MRMNHTVWINVFFVAGEWHSIGHGFKHTATHIKQNTGSFLPGITDWIIYLLGWQWQTYENWGILLLIVHWLDWCHIMTVGRRNEHWKLMRAPHVPPKMGRSGYVEEDAVISSALVCNRITWTGFRRVGNESECTTTAKIIAIPQPTISSNKLHNLYKLYKLKTSILLRFENKSKSSPFPRSNGLNPLSYKCRCRTVVLWWFQIFLVFSPRKLGKWSNLTCAYPPEV